MDVCFSYIEIVWQEDDNKSYPQQFLTVHVSVYDITLSEVLHEGRWSHCANNNCPCCPCFRVAAISLSNPFLRAANPGNPFRPDFQECGHPPSYSTLGYCNIQATSLSGHLHTPATPTSRLLSYLDCLHMQGTKVRCFQRCPADTSAEDTSPKQWHNTSMQWLGLGELHRG
jgi:hypothetical protein